MTTSANGTPATGHAGPDRSRLHAEPARHSQDFASVVWFGTYYVFTASQARVVAELWAAWRNGTPDVRQDYLLEAAGSESRRLDNLFRGHPAWGAMIQRGPVRGVYRLVEPVEG